MRFQDLVWEPHPIFGDTADYRAWRAQIREALPNLPRFLTEGNAEWARVAFPNGRRLTILRNLDSLRPFYGYETRRHPDGEPIDHDSPEGVQAELDAVEALPVVMS
jgi:hypothetical protein